MAIIGDYRGTASLLNVLGAIAIRKKMIENIKRTLHDALNEKPCKFVSHSAFQDIFLQARIKPPHITETSP